MILVVFLQWPPGYKPGFCLETLIREIFSEHPQLELPTEAQRWLSEAEGLCTPEQPSTLSSEARRWLEEADFSTLEDEVAEKLCAATGHYVASGKTEAQRWLLEAEETCLLETSCLEREQPSVLACEARRWLHEAGFPPLEEEVPALLWPATDECVAPEPTEAQRWLWEAEEPCVLETSCQQPSALACERRWLDEVGFPPLEEEEPATLRAAVGECGSPEPARCEADRWLEEIGEQRLPVQDIPLAVVKERCMAGFRGDTPSSRAGRMMRRLCGLFRRSTGASAKELSCIK